jgi:DNA repair protein RadC
LHENHRKRVKERFLSEGLDSFAPHNIVELLLFYSIPQRDVNELAHSLIKRFGSVSGVLDAPYDQLVRVDGIKENTAAHIKLVQSLMRVYALEKQREVAVLDTQEKIGSFLTSWYIGVTVETVLLVSLNNKRSIIDLSVLHEGSVNSAQVSVRKIAETALAKNASAIVLAHNHPDGMAIPSSEDINSTRYIKSAMDLLEINLLDHILVAGDKYTSVLY